MQRGQHIPQKHRIEITPELNHKTGNPWNGNLQMNILGDELPVQQNDSSHE
jgi:hypothetical protein